MRTALSEREEGDKQILIASAGPANINEMALEFSNVSERSLKARGITIKTIKVPPSWIKDRLHELSYLAYFCNPKESISALVKTAESKDIEVGVYRY